MTGSEDLGTQQHEAIAATLSHNAPCGFLVIDLKERVLYANATLARWLGRDTAALDGNVKFSDILTPTSHLYYQTQIAPMIQLQGFAREIACKLKRQGGADAFPVLMNAVLRQAGDNPRVEIVLFDTTERTRFEDQLRRARAEAEELATIVRNAAVGIVRCTAEGKIKRLNDAAAAILGVETGIIPTGSIDSLLRLECEATDWFKDALAQIETADADFRFESGLANTFYNISVAKIANPEDPFADPEYSVIIRDITQRVLSEQRLNLLVGELNHRVRNVFTIVLGLVRQTIRASHPDREKLIDRLHSVSASHDILTRNFWKDASITEIFEPLKAQAGNAQTIVTRGPDIRLEPNQFKALSMAIHELSTNARKYGALSSDTGRIEIDWSLDVRRTNAFELRWRESGDLTVVAPEKTGFGTQMIQRMLTVEFDGSAIYSYHTDGLEFTFSGTLKPS